MTSSEVDCLMIVRNFETELTVRGVRSN